MNDPLFQHNRRPVVVADSRLRAGNASARVRGDDPEAVLVQYLRLIRRVRNRQRDRTIALRRVDLAALADHLGWTDDQVLSRLADLMGSSRRQRTTMAAALAAGAGLITVAGSSAAAPPESGASTPTDDGDPIVVVADHLAPTTSVATREHAARLLPLHGRVGRGDVSVRSAVARGNDIAQSPADDATARPGVETPADDATGEPQPPTTADDATGEPSPPTTADDATGEPSPPTTADDLEAQAPTDAHPAADGSGGHPAPAGNELATRGAATDQDGNLVAVGEPPVPPATDQDGNLVAVGEPPIAPATDQDGNLVAVGEPPVPPTPESGAADAPEPPPVAP